MLLELGLALVATTVWVVSVAAGVGG